MHACAHQSLFYDMTPEGRAWCAGLAQRLSGYYQVEDDSTWCAFGTIAPTIGVRISCTLDEIPAEWRLYIGHATQPLFQTIDNDGWRDIEGQLIDLAEIPPAVKLLLEQIDEFVAIQLRKRMCGWSVSCVPPHDAIRFWTVQVTQPVGTFSIEITSDAFVRISFVPLPPCTLHVPTSHPSAMTVRPLPLMMNDNATLADVFETLLRFDADVQDMEMNDNDADHQEEEEEACMDVCYDS